MSTLRSSPELPGVRQRQVEANGLSVHVAEAGPSIGPAVVLQHGWPQHWYAWREVIGPLAERYRVICPDMRGLGWTSAPTGGYAKQKLAEDAVALLDALELERVHYVGHDWGGFVGFLLGIEAPERLSSLVAMSIPHLWPAEGLPDPRPALRLWYQVVLAAPGSGRVQPAFVRRLLSAAREIGSFSEAELDLYARQFTEGGRAGATQRLYRTFLLHELLPLVRGEYRSRRLEVRTLQLVGSRDPVLPPAGLGGFEPFADDMSAELIDGAGHFLPEEVPQLISARLVEFLG